jgi:hypothetical protein
MLQMLMPLALVFALPPSGESSRLQLDFVLTVAPAVDHWDFIGVPNQFGLEAGQKDTLTVFSRRVVDDDDAPPPLQPFLQRVARFSFTASGDSGYDYFGNSSERRDFGGFAVAAHADGYLGRYVYVGGSFGYGRSLSTFTNPANNSGYCGLEVCSIDEQRLPFQLAAGVRFASTQVWATWGATAYLADYAVNADWRVRYWAHVGMRAYSVVHRHIELAGGWQLIESGFGIDGAATLWLGRRLGVGLGAFYRNGNPIDARNVYSTSFTVGGDISGRWWLSRRWALALDFSPRYGRVAENSIPDPTRVSYDITLGLTFRPRR